MTVAPTRSSRASLVAALAACFALGASAVAHGKLKLETGGYVETDVRFAMPGKVLEDRAWTFRFNENRFGLQVDAEVTSNVSAKLQTRTVFIGFSDVPTAFDLTQRAKLDPFWWELDAAYMEFRDAFGVEGLDIRAGRQIVRWGTADQFNPTNNLMPLDLRDPLLFGQNIANNMIRVDYAPGKDVTLQAVWVPVFRATQLPVFGLGILKDPTAFQRRFGTTGTFLDTAATSGIKPEYILNTRVPDVSLDNSMVGAKVGFKAFGTDFSASYFRGFFHVPRPQAIGTKLVTLTDAKAEVELGYPRMQAVGFDFTTSIPKLKIGFWGEAAIVFHDKLLTDVTTEIVGVGVSRVQIAEAAGSYFWKLTTGIDYTFTKNLYANIQYLHGFVDEFGSGQLGDYIVAGVDIKSTSEKVLLRMFGVLNLQDRSHVYFPSLIFKPWGATEIQVGALLYGGERGSKFGGQESGSNLFFMKGRLSF